MTGTHDAQANGMARASLDPSAWRMLTLAAALLYGAVLSQVPNENFFDFSNYLIYAETPWEQLSALWAVNPFFALANEPVWLLINAAFASVLPPEAVVRTIIFLSATTVAFRVLRYDARLLPWLLVLLFMPMVIKNFLIHIRQGTAIALFVGGWFATRPKVRWSLMALAPFVHTSFVFVFFMLGLALATRRLRLGPGLRLPVFAGVGVSIGVGLGWLASVLGARQADEYSFGMTDISGMGFLLWATVFSLMCFQGQRYLRKHVFESSVILFYLGTYFFIEVTARIFESGAVLVLLAVLSMSGWRRNAALLVVCAVALLQWGARLNQPLLGFGLA
jgi:hypothetical protein